jgi:hypothetical protein
MATVLIQNGAFSGALGAILAGRPVTSSTGADYAGAIAAANAFASRFITANAALGAPMADADNAQIGQMIESVCYGVLEGRNYTSSTAADYAEEAAAAVAACKQAETSLTA